MFKLAASFVALATLAQAANFRRVACPDGVNTATNEACCVFFALRDDLQANVFGNVCGEDVHEVLRLSFHDSIGFSKSGAGAGGGADGSLIVFDPIETEFGANAGLDDPVDALTPFLSSHPVTAGDLIQFAAAVGITNCPGAPQLNFLAGRPNATVAAADGLIPEPQQDVPTIIARITDAGLDPEDMVNLLISHTIARADHVDPTIQQVPFDSTPFTFDSQFFLETLLRGTGVPGTEGNSGEVDSGIPDERVMKLQSDFAFSQDEGFACQWQSFINNQQKMMDAFKTSMLKMSVIGQDVSSLVDCSEVIPVPVAPLSTSASFPPQKSIDDVLQVCPDAFPTLSQQPGQPSQVPLCPDGTNTC